MSSRPAVSVLLPVRDGLPHLPRALRSLSRQSFSDYEVIAVDDGSRDGSREVLREAATEDDRIRVLLREPRGIVGALETARRVARGRYLARMDADDVCLPRRLERQHALLEAEPGLVGCGTRVEYFPRSRVTDGGRRYESWINDLVHPGSIEGDLFVECPLPHPTFFLRTRAVERIGGYRDRGWPEDYDLLLRLWEAGGRLGKVPEVLLRWREGEDRLSRTSSTYSADAFRRCKAHFLRRTLLPGREGAVVWGAGPTGKAFARTLEGEGARLRAFVEVDPRKIGQEIHGLPVVGVEDAPEFADALHLAAVGQEGARDRIRESLRGFGWTEMEDFVAVA